MKRLLSIAIVCLLLLSCASADSVSSLCEQWNSLGKHYSSVELTEDIAVQKDGRITFTGDGWKLFFWEDDSNLGVYAEDFQTLMCNSAAAGLMVADDASGFTEYLGGIAYQFITLISGETPLMLGYSGYLYNVAQIDKGYMMLLKKY